MFKLDELGSEIAQISIPAALALAADPVASLVDTAFIGRIGTYYPIIHSYLHSLPIPDTNDISFEMQVRWSLQPWEYQSRCSINCPRLQSIRY